MFSDIETQVKNELFLSVNSPNLTTYLPSPFQANTLQIYSSESCKSIKYKFIFPGTEVVILPWLCAEIWGRLEGREE